MTEYKAFTPTEFKADSHGTAQFVIATTGVVDSDGDVLLPGAIGKQVSTLLPTHNWNSVPLGKAWISEQGNQVIADVQFNPTPEGQSWYQAIKWDFENPPPVQQYSWGYTPTKSHPGEHDGQSVRFLETVAIHETSPVVVGASIGTLTAGVKRFDVLTPAELEIVKAARREVDDAETEMRDQVKAIADTFMAGRKAEWLDRVATEYNADMGHSTTMVPESIVPTLTRQLAHATAALAAKQLEIKQPELRWFTQRPAELTLYGRAMPAHHVIWLNDELTAADVIATAPHEVAHCAGRDETACCAYEATFLERLGLR